MQLRPHQSINPATEEELASFEVETSTSLNEKREAARTAFQDWRKLDVKERAGYLRKLGKYLKNNAEEMGQLITLEMGKPFAQAIAEVKKCALCCEYYAEEGPKELKELKIPSSHKESYVRYEPLGVIYIVMPWNFPFWQVIRCAVPALLAGNTILLKHAENVPQCALKIEDCFREAGFPDGVFTNLFLTHEQSDDLIAWDGVHGVSLTGSVRAGSAIASQAGKYIKPSVLELGGSDPFIVLDDADVEKAAEMGVKSRFQNTGQSCIAAKRFILQQSVADQFISFFKEKIEALKVGDPFEEDVDQGPLARQDLMETLQKQVEKTVAMGAKVLTGGKRLDRKGYYFQPTLLTDIPPGSPADMEELFGPVASVWIVDTEDEAIRIANKTEFGLGANLWTRDRDRADRLSRRIKAGSVFINSMVKSEPALPFGGVKKSGYGRELSGFGLHEFVNIKTVCFD